MPLPPIDGVETFLLVLVRCLTFWGIGPLLADRKIPPQIKLLGALATAIAIWPTVDPTGWVMEPSALGLALLIGREVILGAALGLTASLVFLGVRTAGSLLGIQMGFSFANVIDPNTSTEVSVLAEMQELLAVFLFLLVDGHHLLFRALAFSLERVPPGGAIDTARLCGAVLPMAGTVFQATLQIGAPVLGALFLTDAALGFVARAVPQMNVFIVGIPVKIGAGLLLLIVTAPLFARLLQWQFAALEGRLQTVLLGM